MSLIPTLSEHALQRMDEMDVRLTAVTEALNYPEMDYPAIPVHQRDHPGARVACKGAIAVCYSPTNNPDRPFVFTVLWNRKDHVRPNG